MSIVKTGYMVFSPIKDGEIDEEEPCERCEEEPPEFHVLVDSRPFLESVEQAEGAAVCSACAERF